MDHTELPDFLRQLATASAAEILPRFRTRDLAIDRKDDQSPVTEADRKAESVLRQLIHARFPDHGIIGEEFPDQMPDAPFTWVLDPIDGTRSFVAGVPLFGTLICLRQGLKPIWSAIHLPALQQLFIGNNQQAWLNGSPLRLPKNPPPLGACTVLTTDPSTPPNIHSPKGWSNLLKATDACRTWGDCYGYTLVASGQPVIMTDPVLNLWDLAALLPVLRGAGAAASDWQGNPPDQATSLLAAHPSLLPKILQLLNPA